jgi:hypothetical protein
MSAHKPAYKPATTKPTKKIVMAPQMPKKTHAANWGYRGAGGTCALGRPYIHVQGMLDGPASISG